MVALRLVQVRVLCQMRAPYRPITAHNKCSAVAEMGDRLATMDVGRKLGDCAPFKRGKLGDWVPM